MSDDEEGLRQVLSNTLSEGQSPNLLAIGCLSMMAAGGCDGGIALIYSARIHELPPDGSIVVVQLDYRDVAPEDPRPRLSLNGAGIYPNSKFEELAGQLETRAPIVQSEPVLGIGMDDDYEAFETFYYVEP